MDQQTIDSKRKQRESENSRVAEIFTTLENMEILNDIETAIALLREGLRFTLIPKEQHNYFGDILRNLEQVRQRRILLGYLERVNNDLEEGHFDHAAENAQKAVGVIGIPEGIHTQEEEIITLMTTAPENTAYRSEETQ